MSFEQLQTLPYFKGSISVSKATSGSAAIIGEDKAMV
jgi:hypothetical protein